MSQTPEFLKESLKFGINLGLERMIKIDELLGNPQEDFKVIHVAGTNGKGSTCTYIASILAASGLKVGLYTSPYLERFNERMMIIDGKDALVKRLTDEAYGEIPEDELAELSDMVKSASDLMVSDGFEHPTEFELTTAICYLWFSRQKVDVAVLETGLGGRLDSTNVFSTPLCSVITAMGMDHSDRLGNTIAEITGEKAGIIKSGCPVWAYEPTEMILDSASQIDVKNVIEKVASEKSAPLHFSVSGEREVVFDTDGYMSFSFDGMELKTRLMGRHQVNNAILAINVCRETFGVSDSDIVSGVSLARWKGRAECLKLNPPVILDGGHNRQCAESLVSVLDEMLCGSLIGSSFVGVMGVMADKDYDGMLEIFKDGGINFGRIYSVTVNNPRSLKAEEFGNRIKNVYNNKVEVLCFEDANEAVKAAYEYATSEGKPMLVTGSLYLIGQIRQDLKALI